jgi:hypothetical protein
LTGERVILALGVEDNVAANEGSERPGREKSEKRPGAREDGARDR